MINFIANKDQQLSRMKYICFLCFCSDRFSHFVLFILLNTQMQMGCKQFASNSTELPPHVVAC